MCTRKEPRSPLALKADFGKKVVCTYSSITKHAYALVYARLIPPRHMLPGCGKIQVKKFILQAASDVGISSEAVDVLSSELIRFLEALLAHHLALQCR